MRKFESVHGQELDIVQDRLEEVLGQFSDAQIVNGQLIKGVELTSGQNNDVNHGLQRSPSYIVCGKDAVATITNDQDGNPFPTRTLRLLTTADVKVDLWVF
jgi:hypothetical protein